MRRYKKDRSAFEGFLQQISVVANGLNPELRVQLEGLFGVLGQFQKYSQDGGYQQEPVRFAGELVLDQRF